MLVLSVISQKGGAGKTTLACSLAVAAERSGLAAVLVDLDPQGTAAKWGELREADTPVVTAAATDRLVAVIEAARNAGAAIAVVDTPPHSADAALAAARVADLVLIPCRPSAADLHAIGASIELVREAGSPALVILNACPVRNPLTGQALEAITGYGLDAAEVVVHQRIDHVHAFTAGQSAAEISPRSKAGREIEQLFAALRQRPLPFDQETSP